MPKFILIAITLIAAAIGTRLLPVQIFDQAVPVPSPATTHGPANPIVMTARSQVGKTLRYDLACRQPSYPGGDIPLEVGVCTDIVIRAMRQSHRLDLQKLVHEDMKKNFSRYPKKMGFNQTR